MEGEKRKERTVGETDEGDTRIRRVREGNKKKGRNKGTRGEGQKMKRGRKKK